MSDDEKIQDLQDMIGYVALHVDQRYVVTQLTTEQKELWADAVEAWQQRMHADDPDISPTPYDRWWRNWKGRYDADTPIRHILISNQMDYDIHAWACDQWGYPPTATAQALTLCDTLGEAKEFLDRKKADDLCERCKTNPADRTTTRDQWIPPQRICGDCVTF